MVHARQPGGPGPLRRPDANHGRAGQFRRPQRRLLRRGLRSAGQPGSGRLPLRHVRGPALWRPSSSPSPGPRPAICGGPAATESATACPTTPCNGRASNGPRPTARKFTISGASPTPSANWPRPCPDARMAADAVPVNLDELPEGDLWGVFRFKQGFGGDVTRTVGAWDLALSPVLYAAYKKGLGIRDWGLGIRAMADRLGQHNPIPNPQSPIPNPGSPPCPPCPPPTSSNPGNGAK